jgi:HK97 family phage major capsid protein
MPSVLDRLRTEYTTAQDRYRAVEALAADEDRDPTDAEQAELDQLAERLRGLQPRIVGQTELERTLAAGNEALAGLPSVPVPGRPARREAQAPRPAERYRSWGEYAQAVAMGDVSREDRAAIDTSTLDYLIEHARAFVDVTTADVPGIVPPVWIRTIADTISAAQPFVQAFSQLPLPDSGMTLTYPAIATRPLVGKQTAEKTEVPSRKTTITPHTANVATYGGGEDVSVQVLQRTDPSYLGLMLDLYAEAMALVVNTDAITAALAAITAPAVDLGADATGYNAALAQAAADVLTNSRLMPDTLVVSVDMWQAFAGASDPDGRPLFPNVAPSNPVGSSSLDSTTGNARGLTFVVDPMMPANTGVLGARAAFTSLLGAVQTLSADNVAKLGRDYAVFRFAAFITRRPDALVKLTTPVVTP